jgi:hypothetical protein
VTARAVYASNLGLLREIQIELVLVLLDNPLVVEGDRVTKLTYTVRR